MEEALDQIRRIVGSWRDHTGEGRGEEEGGGGGEAAGVGGPGGEKEGGEVGEEAEDTS